MSAQQRKAGSPFRVVMEGTPLTAVKEKRKLSETKLSTSQNGPAKPIPRSFVLRSGMKEENKPTTKPAILPKTGTVGAVPVMKDAERKKPVEKPSTLKHMALPVSTRLVPQLNQMSALESTAAASRVSPTSSSINVDFLVQEAIEISRQVDNTFLHRQSSPAVVKPRRSKGARLGAADNSAKEAIDVSDIYETEETRLVDSLISRLKQSAEGILLTDTDHKIREVTKQIAESLGVPPEDLDPDLFRTDYQLTLDSVKRLGIDADSSIDLSSKDASAVSQVEAGERSKLEVGDHHKSQSKIDPELSEIIESMPETGEDIKEAHEHSSGAVDSEYNSDEMSEFDLDEMGQLAALPEEVTLTDVLHIAGRPFKFSNLDQLEKGTHTVVTSSRLQKTLEDATQHHVDDGRVHIHNLCFGVPNSEGLLQNEMQQVAFEAHVNRKYNRKADLNANDRPVWYKSALEDLRRHVSSKDNPNSRAGFNFGGSNEEVPFVSVNDALTIPGLEEQKWPPSNKLSSSVGPLKGVTGDAMEIWDAGDPKFPDFATGPPLLSLTPMEARKRLFPKFESSADTRADDYLLTKLDSRFVPGAGDKLSPFDLFLLKIRRGTTLSLERMVSKDDTSLLSRFANRLPAKSPRVPRFKLLYADLPVHGGSSVDIATSVQSLRRRRRSGSLIRLNKRKYRSNSMSKFDDLLESYGFNEEPTVKIKQDYRQAIAEVELHKILCKKMETEKKEEAERIEAENAAEEERLARLAAAEAEEKAAEEFAEEQEIDESKLPGVGDMEFREDGTILSRIDTVEQTRKLQIPSPAELALWSVRRPGAVKRLPKKLKPRKLDSDKLAWVKARLVQVPRRLSRRSSCPPACKKQYRIHHAPFGPRSKSPDVILNFEEYAKRNGMTSEDDPREWARGIWDFWFDEVIPLLSDFEEQPAKRNTQEVPKDTGKALAESLAVLINTENKVAEVQEDTVELYEASTIFDLELPESDDEIEREKTLILQEEVGRMTQLLDHPLRTPTRAFCLTRRGAVLRKMGKLASALADLNEALEIQQHFVDALWHRHFIYLTENKIPLALEDLALIVRSYRFHGGAYMSRAAIYSAKEDILEAIDDYTMAIRCTPKNSEAYFLRAKLYERKGEPLLAMEDYMRANQLTPHDTTALLCHAKHYIKTQNYPVAVQDLTQVLERDPSNAEIYIMRGQCLVHQQRFELAAADFSAAIYLTPNNPEPYFQRGCLLRKINPDRALNDFSVSLLLDYSLKNVKALLHRGILYFEIGLDREAEGDFEAILRLDRDHPAAHTNLGRIYLNKRLDYIRAVKRFTVATRADPTYREAFLCRAEANMKLRNFKGAVIDFTKAIHLDPSDYSVYVHRGAVVLASGNYELAAFCIRQATEAQKDEGLGSAVYQKAFVQAFLKRFDKAIEILQSSLRGYFSSAQAYTVLGKVYMKARDFKQAIDAFTQALNAMRPKRDVINAKWPEEAPEIYYLLGCSYVQQRKWNIALEALNDAIKLKPSLAEAYYKRAIVRFALKHQKAVEDIHRALALDTKNFEAFLTRAVYFAQRKLWPLAIVNCSEALKLQPNCVRAYLYRGAFKYFNRNYRGAVEDLNAAIKIDRSCVIALFNRACANHAADCIKLALRDYSTILLVESQRNTNRITFQTYVNRGLLYFNRGDFANALADFRQAAEMKPRDASLTHALALCFHKQNHLKKSVTTYTTLLSYYPRFNDGYIGRSNALVDYNTMAARKYAMKELKRMLIINPELQSARINLAICLQMTGKLHQAYRQLSIVISEMQRSRDTAPISLANAFELRGVVSLQAQSLDASFQDLTAAARIRPSAAIYNNRGVCNLFMKCRQAAVKDFREALRLDQRFSLAYFNLANIFMVDKRWEQARDFFDRALLFKLNNDTALVNRAITHTKLNNLTGAFQDLNAANPLSPHAHHIAYNRAVLHRVVKKVVASLRDIELAIRLKPDDPHLYKFRSTVKGELGENQSSMDDFSYAVDLESYMKEIKEQDHQNAKQIVPI